MDTFLAISAYLTIGAFYTYCISYSKMGEMRGKIEEIKGDALRNHGVKMPEELAILMVMVALFILTAFWPIFAIKRFFKF